MHLSQIHRRAFRDPDLAAVQEATAAAVESDPAPFFDHYRREPRSLGGRYIASDLFKETFPLYRQSKAARQKYNVAVHNASAVLADAYFRLTVQDGSDQDKDTVIFITGQPGAGKTSSMLAGGGLPSHFRAVYEGQLAQPELAIPKIDLAINAGCRAVILVVHTLPENALDHACNRFEEYGRGASITALAMIQGGLPAGLAAIRDRHGDSVELAVFEYRNRADAHVLFGWEHLALLKSEGNYDQIRNRLITHLERCRQSGTITENAYLQARGEEIGGIGVDTKNG